MPAKLTVSPITPADIDAVQALLAQVQAIHVASEPEFFRDPDPAEMRAYIAHQLADPNVGGLLARLDGVAAGYLMFEETIKPATPFTHERHFLYIDQLSIDAAHRRRGVGKALLTELRAIASARGITELQASHYLFNTASDRFFTSNDMRVYSVRRAGPA